MFCVGERIVHPLHGAGEILEIVEKKYDGVTKEYYAVKIFAGNVSILVPVDSAERVGMRPVMGEKEARRLLGSFSALELEIDRNWNRRYRDNLVRIRSGNPDEVARVIKSLVARDREKGLSTGERKMLHTAKQILASELVLSLSVPYEEAERLLMTALE